MTVDLIRCEGKLLKQVFVGHIPCGAMRWSRGKSLLSVGELFAAELLLLVVARDPAQRVLPVMRGG
jgi:hypothetical protein